MAEIRRARGRVAIISNLTWCGREASLSCGSVGKQRVDWEEPDKKVHHWDEWVVKTQCGLPGGVQRNTVFGKNTTICTGMFLGMSFPPLLAIITSPPTVPNSIIKFPPVSPCDAFVVVGSQALMGNRVSASWKSEWKRKKKKKTIKCKYINRKRSSDQEEGRNHSTEPETSES